MSQEDELLRAKQHIQSKRYNEARLILKRLDNPIARKWLIKLEEIAPENTLQQRTFTMRHIVFTAIVVGIASLLFGLRLGSLVQQGSTISSSTIDTQTALIDGLQMYCQIPIDLLQAMDSWKQRNNLAPAYLQLVGANVTDVCRSWATTTLNQNYEAVNYCSNLADSEYREATFYECLDERNFHFGAILGDEWQITASQALMLEQSLRQVYGLSSNMDLRTDDIP